MIDGGLLVSLEGCDGSGKTSVASTIVDILNRLGYDATYLREPTNESASGIQVRQYLDNHITIDENALMDLFINDRFYDMEHNITPALEAGKIVVMDRYYISNAVYEHSDLWPWQKIMERNRKYFIEPAAVFILRPGVETCWSRIVLRGDPISQYETKSELWRTQEIYDDIAKNDTGNYIIIDSNDKLPYQTSLEIIDHILELVSLKEYWEDPDKKEEEDELDLVE
jgi:dTMP kinase